MSRSMVEVEGPLLAALEAEAPAIKLELGISKLSRKDLVGFALKRFLDSRDSEEVEAFVAENATPSQQPVNTDATKTSFAKKEKNQKKESSISLKKTKKERTEQLRAEIKALKARYSDTHLINTTLKAIAGTRKTGHIALSVVKNILRKWSDVSEEAVVEGCQRYLDGDYASEGKAEAYLWGIIRRVAGDFRQNAYRQTSLQAKPRPRPDQDNGRPIPPKFDLEAKTKADAERNRIFDAWQTTVIEALENADEATRARIEQQAQQSIENFPKSLRTQKLLTAARLEAATKILGIRRPT